ncbi:hypothetical protein CTM88_02400 [Photobacterium aquimaris]|uniref:Uncharacterized protein n=1 Tax=Photobacterium aquimaris TaxID=512643 RepID=A0A2T3IRX4_9GAMM|nr:hypothetical protein [Photobacterium aquimaris]OBU23405.1 hypothetical protein AYY20_00830 [Photobacterium aquimaris]PSU31109.1 hypothetical protein CTM88_02400 [Photobacterium aquimaris]
MNYTATEKFEMLVTRLGFTITRKVLAPALGFSALGVEPFKDKINERLTSQPDIATKIDDIWRDVVFGGNRKVKIYKSVNQTLFDTIDQFFTASMAALPNHAYIQSFPFPVADSVLDTCNTDLVLCDYSTQVLSANRTIKCAILSNKAHYTKTEPVSRTQLTSAGQVLIPQGAELFCRKRVSTQCFHAIILDESTNNVFVAVDVSALPNQEAGIEFLNLRNYLRDTVRANLVTTANLFPAIERLYNDVDGRIHSVSFVTDDGNTDSIKLPTLTSPACIKLDQYHVAGETAASVLSKFKVTKLWDLSDLSIGVELNGRKVMLHSNGPLDSLTTHNCTKLTENIYVLDKVLQHV